jgi:hypothetical protein
MRTAEIKRIWQEDFNNVTANTNADARLTSINSWILTSNGKTKGTLKIYTNPEGWTIGKGRCDNGWTIRRPDGTSPERETFRSLLAAQLRTADYMGV